MKRFLAPGFLVALALPGWGGDIQGKVVIESKLSKPPRGRVMDRVDPILSPSYDGPLEELPPLQSVVVYVKGSVLSCTPHLKRGVHETMRIKDKQLIPEVLVLPKGSKVYFENVDPYIHHPYSDSQPGAFEFCRFAHGVKSITFDSAAVVQVCCGIHPRECAWLMLSENDFYAQPDSAGKYRLNGIPPGRYTLRAWHPRLAREVEQTVQVPDKGVVTLDWTL